MLEKFKKRFDPPAEFHQATTPVINSEIQINETSDEATQIVPEIKTEYTYHQTKEIIEQELTRFKQETGAKKLRPINFSRENEKSKIQFELPGNIDVIKMMAVLSNALGDIQISSGYSTSSFFITSKDDLRIYLNSHFYKEGFSIDFSSKRELKPQEIEAIINIYKMTNEKVESPKEALESFGATVFNPQEAPNWDFIAGYDKAKIQVRESIIYPFQHPEIYEQIVKNTRKNYENNRPKAVLFEGPPGTGKTTMARLIAGEVNANLIYVPIESIMSKWYGESERNLGYIFDKCAELGNSLLFLDEIDSLATSRDKDMHEATRRVLSVLLRKIDGFNPNSNTILIGATNRKNDLDSALLSRFNNSIEFPLPNLLERREIFRNYASQLSDDELLLIAEKTDNFSGRDIKNLCERVERSFASEIISSNAETIGSPNINKYLSELI